MLSSLTLKVTLISYSYSCSYFYYFYLLLKRNNKYILLLVGESASSQPRDLDEEQWTDEELDLRNEAVDDVLPRVAYGCSDIVVFVTEESLATNAAKKSILNFSYRQSENISSPKPALFIISNRKDPSREELDFRETTANFKRTHDRKRDLEDMYSSVVVFNVPDWAFGR